MSSIFSQTPRGLSLQWTSNPLQISTSSISNPWFLDQWFFQLAGFKCQGWDSWDLKLYICISYILREEGTCYSTTPTGCQGSNQYRLTQGQIQCRQGGLVEHWSREAPEDWKIQQFQLGEKGVWEWLVVDQPISWACFERAKRPQPFFTARFWKINCLMARQFLGTRWNSNSGGCSWGSSAWSTLLPRQGDGRFPGEAWNESVFFAESSEKRATLSQATISKPSNHQRWICIKSDIEIIWWGMKLFPSNYIINLYNPQQTFNDVGEMKPWDVVPTQWGGSSIWIQ